MGLLKSGVKKNWGSIRDNLEVASVSFVGKPWGW